jgi:hypothetical protein
MGLDADVTQQPGPPGNERLTSTVGLVLLVLLVVEAATTLSLSSYLPEHIFLGLLLLPPLALKLASTGWRFMRYYTGSKPYRLAGPPKLPLRMLAPLLIASTLILFGSGVGLIAIGHRNGLLKSVHAVSFAVWGGLIVVHVVAYLSRVFRDGPADWRRHTGQDVAGARDRRLAVSGALVAGLVVALATYPAQRHWLNHRGHHGHDDESAPARATSGL